MRFAPWLVAALASNVFALAACGDDGGSSSLNGFKVGDVTVSTAEDTPISVAIPVQAATTTNITVTIATQPQHGTVTATEGDVTTYSYTPALNYDGSDEFTATVTDGTNTGTATVGITVTPVDDAPVAGMAMFTTPLDTVLSIPTSQLLADVTDIDSTTLSIVSVQGAINGDAALDGDTVTFTPANQFFGIATFSYTASDGQLTGNGIVSVNVGGNNHPPVAVADSATTAENTPLVLAAATLTGNDTDADGNTLTITTVSNAQHGTAAFDSSANTVTFTPDPNFHGGASFDYSISDGNGGSATATVAVTVTHVNQNPVANPDSVTVAQGTIATINVLANDTDPDGDGLTLTSVTQGANGSVTFTGGVVSYTPNASFTGTDSFTYTISDGNGGTATGTVTATVQGVNHSPTAVADSMTVSENASGTDNVLANDSDPDGDTLVITGVTNPQHGVVSVAGGVATYTPNPNFVGSDAFTYTISDGRGGTATAIVSVNVVPVNRPPVATNDLMSVPENSSGSVNVTANDNDPDGDPISVSNFTQPAHGAVTFAGNVATYTPAHDFSGNDAFTYTISDGRGGSATGVVSVAVSHVNQLPVAQNDTLSTTENTQGSVNVITNDTDPDGDTLAVTAFTQPLHGTVGFSNTVALYTPAQNFFGTDSFSYTISDGHGGTASAFVAVTVQQGTPVVTNHAPVASNFAASVHLAATIPVIPGHATDQDDDSLTVNGASDTGGHGTASPAGTSVTYSASENYAQGNCVGETGNGTDTFTYTVSDGQLTSNTATVTVTLTNAPPTASAASQTIPVQQSQQVTIQLAGADPDGDAVTFSLVGEGASHGTVSIDPASGIATYQANNEGGFPAGGDSFQFTVSDGCLTSAPATVTLTSTPASCGDGVTQAPEQCDNGPSNAANAYGPGQCTDQCQNAPTCGDGITNGPEQCDDGGNNGTSNDTCTSSCTFTCGDGILGDGENEPAEQCDDGNSVGGDGCESNCTITCGEFTNENGVTTLPDQRGNVFAVTTDAVTGSCFAFYSGETGFTYAQAAAACAARGGHLATIADDTENQAAETAAGPSATPWLGGNDIADNGNHWITGEPFAFQPANNDPDNTSQPSCLAYDGGTSPDQFSSIPCGDGQSQTGLLCEFDLFPNQDTFATPGVPSSLVAAQINGDSAMDVAYLNAATKSVGVMLGDGAGGFRPQTVAVLPGTPSALAAGDLDGDNITDLAVTIPASDSVVVLHGNGDGSFNPNPIFTLNANIDDGAGNPVAIAIADIDGDSFPDIIIADSLAGAVGVFYGGNEGGFGSIQGYGVADGSVDDVGDGASPIAMAVGPVDALSPPTIGIAVAGLANIPSAPTVTVLSITADSDGSRDLQQASISEDDLGGTPASIALGDFDDDGSPDVAIGFSDTQGIQVFFGIPANEGDGGGGDDGDDEPGPAPVPVGSPGFASIDSTQIQTGVPATTLGAIPGTPALLVYGSQNSITALGVFDGGEGLRTGIASHVTSFALASFDGDTLADVVAAGDNSNAITELPGRLLSESDTLGNFGVTDSVKPFDTVSLSNPLGLVSADLHDFNGVGENGAADPDLVVVNSSDNTIGVIRNSDLASGGLVTTSSTIAVGQSPFAVAAGDLNGDGFADLVVTNRDDGTITILLNDQSGNFSAQDPITVGPTPAGVVIGDFDDNGTNDIAVALTSTDQVVILSGNNDGTLNGSVTFSLAAGARPTALAAGSLQGPLNGNTGADLVVGNGDGTVTVMINDEDDDFDFSFNTIFGGTAISSVAIGDVNGDTFGDIVAVDSSANAMLLYVNDAIDNGPQGNVFFQPESTPVGAGPTSVVLADLDGNGRPDIAVANHASSNVSLILNLGTPTNNTGDTSNFFFPLGAARPLALGAGPFSIVSGDFDNNGHPDLAVTDQQTETVEVVLSPRGAIQR